MWPSMEWALDDDDEYDITIMISPFAWHVPIRSVYTLGVLDRFPVRAVHNYPGLGGSLYLTFKIAGGYMSARLQTLHLSTPSVSA